MRPLLFILLGAVAFASACKQSEKKTKETPPTVKDSTVAPTPKPEAPAITYHFMKKKDWQAQKDSFEGAKHLDILNAINRTDSAHIKRLDSILVPSDFSQPLTAYLPFPVEADFLANINKIIIFSAATQSFAAYENGKLVLTGQTNTGRKSKPTPPRLYFTNWKARESVSTFDDEWKLKWNFNVHNTWGVGFHQYALPGYPASHSCMRLQEKDAQFLYGWADQWVLKNDQLKANGTPVVVIGKYPFGQPRPWFQLTQNPQALTIPVDSLQAQLNPYMDEITKKQEERKAFLTSLGNQ